MVVRSVPGIGIPVVTRGSKAALCALRSLPAVDAEEPRVSQELTGNALPTPFHLHVRSETEVGTHRSQLHPKMVEGRWNLSDPRKVPGQGLTEPPCCA